MNATSAAEPAAPDAFGTPATAAPSHTAPAQYAHPPFPSYPAYSSYGNPPSYPTYPPYNPSPYSTYMPYPPPPTLISSTRQAGAAVLSTMHEAMSRFARISSMIEEVLRNLHMLFDAIVGLAYSVGAVRQETNAWLTVKGGALVPRVARWLSRASLTRFLCIVLMSPMAGRFSPVAWVLRLLGLVPEVEQESTGAGVGVAERQTYGEDDSGDGSNM